MAFKLEYVVLSAEAAPRKDIRVYPRDVIFGIQDASTITSSVATLSVNERRDLEANNNVIASAPKMPAVLIRSIISNLGGDPPGVSWGFGDTGVQTSSFDGAGCTVAVLDSGIDANHPAFSGVNLVRMDFTGEGLDDLDGHGTHCAGTIFGRDVDGVRIGVARGVRDALIGKIIGKNGGSTEAIVRAVQWARGLGAKVISMSVGLDFVGYHKLLLEKGVPEEKAISLALDGYGQNVLLFEKLSEALAGVPNLVDGTVVVAASGNSSQAPDYTISVETPARSSGFVSVAALDKSSNNKQSLARFSNVGAKIAAPGVDIWSAAPGGGLVSMSGTSMATPLVAGIACLWEQKLRATGVNGTAEEIKNALKTNARTLVPEIPLEDVEWGAALAPRSL